MFRRRCKKLITDDYNTFVYNTETSLDKDIKSFWRFINCKKSSNDIPQTVKYGDLTSSDRKVVCELFSNYFCSVYEKNVTVPSPSSVPYCKNSVLFNIEISQRDILRKIARIDPNKGAGPDGIPPHFIKRCAKQLCTPLSIIFNASLHAGNFPCEWKTAHIVPIFKSGDKSCCENYRPISILSCFGKLFESLVYDSLYHHIEPFLSPRQHGFIKSKSTTSNLLEYKYYLCSAFAKTTQVDAIYTDFSKAFDKVNHSVLCSKLASYGIHGSLLRWLESYLHRRSQLVSIKGFTSSPVVITSGVPQGSHLGPLLFVVFINDLVNKLKSPCSLYADDLKIYSTVTCQSDCMALQSDLSYVYDWCVNNRMFLNIKKCCVITFTTKKQRILSDYSLENHVLDRKSTVKDLGVMFDEKLTFRDHYDYITKRCSKLLGFISRSTKDFKNPKTLVYLYYSLIRSIMEYNAPIWSPFYKIHIDRIEKIQKRFLNILSYRCGIKRSVPSYSDKLNKFKFLSLETRRKYLDLIHLFKILHSIIDSPNLLSCINISTRPRSRFPFQHTFALQVCSNNTSYYNPIVRMCRLYNELLVQNSENLDIFNNKLVKFKNDILAILIEECAKNL